MVKVLAKYNVQLVKESNKKYQVEDSVIKSHSDAAEIIQAVFNLEVAVQEKFVMVALDAKNKVIGAFEVHVGSVACSVVSTRDIFQRLLLVNAVSFIVAHNHPSGSVTPSKEDIDFTHKLQRAGEIMSVELLDHIILGEGQHLSLKEKGYV